MSSAVLTSVAGSRAFNHWIVALVVVVPTFMEILDTTIANVAGYLLSHQTNDSFVAVNRLLAGNEDVYWLKNPITANGKTWPAGTDFIPAKPTTLAKLQKLATEIDQA